MDVAGLALEKVVQLVRGPPGTLVKITFCADTGQRPDHAGDLAGAGEHSLPPSDAMMTQVKAVDSNTVSFKPSNFGRDVVTAPAGNPNENNYLFVKVYALGSIFAGNVQGDRGRSSTVFREPDALMPSVSQTLKAMSCPSRKPRPRLAHPTGV